MVNVTDLKTKYKPIEKLSESVYKVRWNLRPVIDKVKNDETGEEKEVISEVLANWTEEYIYGAPSMEAIQQLILGWYNKQIDFEILSGFEWKGMKVWLSQENQFNYKATFDLAVQNGGIAQPIKFKFGSAREPIYHTFDTMEELTDFYTSAMKFIKDTLANGWATKDAINWDDYKLA